jgi:hypothetical protein
MTSGMPPAQPDKRSANNFVTNTPLRTTKHKKPKNAGRTVRVAGVHRRRKP